MPRMKNRKRRYFRQVISVEVLADERPDFHSLYDVADAITTGGFSGQVEPGKIEEINAAKCAELLQKQGSDPDLFGLTESGEDLER